MEAMEMDELAQGLESVDAFLPSRQEVASLFPGASPEEALDTLITSFPWLKAIVIKLGERGAIGYDGIARQKFSIPAYKARVVDPTGAGDSFCGGFLAGYMKTGDVKRAVLHGVVSASFIVETEGTLGVNGISMSDAQRRLEEMVKEY
jgi:ribokinase